MDPRSVDTREGVLIRDDGRGSYKRWPSLFSQDGGGLKENGGWSGRRREIELRSFDGCRFCPALPFLLCYFPLTPNSQEHQ